MFGVILVQAIAGASGGFMSGLIEYDTYTSDRFGRVLAYPIVDGKNVVVELARKGLVKVTIYEDRRKLKYQDELLKAQAEAKKNKRGIWSSQ